jgi:predicted ATP-dependent protease
MNRETEKAAREQTNAGPQIVDLRERVPQMADDALNTLLANARRLADTGSKLQRSGAADLIPVIEAELAERAAAKAAVMAAKKASVKKAKTKASAN